MNKLYRTLACLTTLACMNQVFAASDSAMKPAPAASAPSTTHAPLKPCTAVSVDNPTQILLGKSTVVRLAAPVARMVVGGLPGGHAGKPIDTSGDRNASDNQTQAQTSSVGGVADVDVILLSPTELFLLGKRAGSMNLVLQSTDGRCLVKDLVVTIDPNTLQLKLAELMPGETGIKVAGAENALVLTGQVSDAIKLDQILTLATSYADGKKIVNLLGIASPQQVML